MTTEWEWMDSEMLNCGPVALGNAIGIDPYIVRHSWPAEWKNPKSDMMLGIIPLDTPWHHIQWMTKQGYTTVVFSDTWEDLCGRMKPERTVILMHDPSSPLLKQHWARIVGIDSEGFLVDMRGSNRVIQRFTRSQLKEYLCSGWPFSAYTVGGPPRDLPRLNWWQRLLLWITK
jgi:hypothetical protein